MPPELQLTIKKRRQKAQYFPEDLGNGITLDMVLIPGGRFLMGSPEDELERSSSEGPQHTVTLSSFFLGKCPVTQSQWKAVAALTQVNRELNPDPSNFKGENRPVEKISWLDAIEFCDRLSQLTGRPYRLPSEAEWEYACRAGTTTPFHFGETITTDLANYNGTYTYGKGIKGLYRNATTPVGSFGVANAFGLYDIHGNVWEWCMDHWHENYEDAPIDGSAWIDPSASENAYRLLRGGSWNDYPQDCRSAYRDRLNADGGFDLYGFRVACSA
jgi:formylglycine-generating enzyme required for sulfatase activity